jgi:hypothetical protein
VISFYAGECEIKRTVFESVIFGQIEQIGILHTQQVVNLNDEMTNM